MLEGIKFGLKASHLFACLLQQILELSDAALQCSIVKLFVGGHGRLNGVKLFPPRGVAIDLLSAWGNDQYDRLGMISLENVAELATIEWMIVLHLSRNRIGVDQDTQVGAIVERFAKNA